MHACAILNRKNKQVKDDLQDYLTFPEHPLLQRFRHEWIMVRQRRPCVPVFADGKMPRANMQEEEKARLAEKKPPPPEDTDSSSEDYSDHEDVNQCQRRKLTALTIRKAAQDATHVSEEESQLREILAKAESWAARAKAAVCRNRRRAIVSL